MIPYDLDPSLHSGEPEPRMLDDGFSPPQAAAEPAPVNSPCRAGTAAPRR